MSKAALFLDVLPPEPVEILEEEISNSWFIPVGIAVAIVLAIAIILVVRHRRKKTKEVEK